LAKMSSAANNGSDKKAASPESAKSKGIDSKSLVIECKEKLEGTSIDQYEKADQYWSTVDPTIDGMLGGFAAISPADLEDSKKLIKLIYKLENSPGKSRAVDCGAGIGRITRNLLKKHFSTVDLVEQNKKFIQKAVDYVGADHQGQFICCGLQDFVPEPNTYDMVWCQWVTGQLTDQHFVQFLQRCSHGLTEHGVIVFKENLTSSGKVEEDDEDHSVTRPEKLVKQLFQKAGLDIVLELTQTKFPKDIYPVKMFALRPMNKSAN